MTFGNHLISVCAAVLVLCAVWAHSDGLAARELDCTPRGQEVRAAGHLWALLWWTTGTWGWLLGRIHWCLTMSWPDARCALACGAAEVAVGLLVDVVVSGISDCLAQQRRPFPLGAVRDPQKPQSRRNDFVLNMQNPHDLHLNLG